MHPRAIACHISTNGGDYRQIGLETVTGDQRSEEVNRLFSFIPEGEFRFVKFDVKGTLRLFDWHPSAGGGSWVFLDEIVAG